MDAFRNAQREPEPLLWGKGEKDASSTGPLWLSISQSCATSVTKHETGLNFPGFWFHTTLWASATHLAPRTGTFGGRFQQPWQCEWSLAGFTACLTTLNRK